MRDFNQMTQYAKDKVKATETPMSLYHRAKRRNAIDSLITVVVASIVLAVSTTQIDSKASIKSPAVREFIQQELVAARTNP